MVLSIELRSRLDGIIVIHARGELDTATAGQLTQAMDEALRTRPAQIRLDLGLLTFMDSVGLGALVTAGATARRAGARVAIENVSPFVRHMLQVMGLHDFFDDAAIGR